MGINREAWLAAVEELDQAPLPNDPDVITSPEFAAMIGKGRCAAARQLALLIKAGKAERAKKLVRRAGGLGVMSVPAYRLVPSPKPKARSGKKR